MRQASPLRLVFDTLFGEDATIAKLRHLHQAVAVLAKVVGCIRARWPRSVLCDQRFGSRGNGVRVPDVVELCTLGCDHLTGLLQQQCH
jgi:hypothetical protein